MGPAEQLTNVLQARAESALCFMLDAFGPPCLSTTVGRGAATPVSKRKFKIIVGGLAGCLLALVGIYIVRSPQEADNDQGKLRQVVRAQRSSSRIRQIERFLPLFL